MVAGHRKKKQLFSLYRQKKRKKEKKKKIKSLESFINAFRCNGREIRCLLHIPIFRPLDSVILPVFAF